MKYAWIAVFLLFAACGNRKEELKKEITTIEEKLYQMQSHQTDALGALNDKYLPMLDDSSLSPEQKNNIIKVMAKSKDSILAKSISNYEKDSLEMELSRLKREYNELK